MQRCDNYSGVLFIIQCDTVIYTALYCTQITTVTELFTVLYWRLCCQYSTVKFTTKFLQCKVITETGSGGKIISAMTTKRRSVFLSNLSVSVEDTDLSEHLIEFGVLGARFRKISPRGATSKSYKVDVSEQYYDTLCNPEIWSEGVKLRDWNPY